VIQFIYKEKKEEEIKIYQLDPMQEKYINGEMDKKEYEYYLTLSGKKWIVD